MGFACEVSPCTHVPTLVVWSNLCVCVCVFVCVCVCVCFKAGTSKCSGLQPSPIPACKHIKYTQRTKPNQTQLAFTNTTNHQTTTTRAMNGCVNMHDGPILRPSQPCTQTGVHTIHMHEHTHHSFIHSFNRHTFIYPLLNRCHKRAAELC